MLHHSSFNIPNSQYAGSRWNRGVTLIELLIALSVIALISSVILASFSEFRARQTLDASVEVVLAAFSAAHLDTISSKNDDIYGINLKSGEVIYFKGSPYPGDNAAGNTHYVLPAPIEIANISLNGGGTTIFYKRLTGATDNFGSFDVRVKAKTIVKSTITINQTGATSL